MKDYCRICNSNTTQPKENMLECVECGSTTVKVLPSIEELSTFYHKFNESYTGGGSSGGKNQVRYAREYISLLKRYICKGSLIDLGCANSPFPNLASQLGLAVTAVDYVKPVDLSEKVKFTIGSLNSEDLGNDGKKYDTVTAWAVIEHVRDPDFAFRVMARLMSDKGKIFLTTPEAGSFLTRHTAGFTPWFYPPEHIHLISPAGIQILAQRNGLRLVEWRHFEITKVRWLARYGIGLAETLSGMICRWLSNRSWANRRITKRSRFNGIALYVLESAR